MKRLFVVHTLPLEFYPPATNMLNFISSEYNHSIYCYSCHNNKNRAVFSNPKVKIYRNNYFAYSSTIISKSFLIILGIIYPLFLLIKIKPEIILYYEPHSSFPVYLYKKYFNKKVQIFIHYHEYYPKEDLEGKNRKLIRFFHKKEVNFLYKHAEWISQTNQDRLSLFQKDYPFLHQHQLHILANYPPLQWQNINPGKIQTDKIKFVYIGSLSFSNTYISEFVEFIKSNPRKTKLDIYSYNYHDDVNKYLENLSAVNIRFYPLGIDYYDIPKIASKYNIGLILYKDHSINYRYNATNKLFEYLACGLDVWFPIEMQGCYPYITEKTFPKVLKTDFTRLDELNLAEVISHEGLKHKKSKYFAENVYRDFFNRYLK